MKNLKRCTALFMVAAIFVFGFASCETETDDGNLKKPVATVTAAPEVSASDIEAGAETALISAGTASGGTLMYAVTTENTKPTSTEGFSATVPTAKELSAGTYYVWYYVKGDASHDDSAISEEAVTVSIGAATFSITVTGGTASLTSSGEAITSASAGTKVYVKAVVPDGKRFGGWQAGAGVTLADPSYPTTYFTMPSSNVTVTAQFLDVYTVTVENGYAYDSVAVAGATVSISANNPPSGKKFDKWVSGSAVTFENENSQNTSFTMIAENVTVTATYKDATATIKDHPDFLFDVVFSNGKACSYNEVQYLTAEQKENACGVVFKTEEGKVWVVELGESSETYAWATGESATTLAGTIEEDGSTNMTIFSNNSSEFPLYAYIEGLAGTNAITGEITDWYLPAYSEIMLLNSYMGGINSILGDLGATTLTTSNTSGYWSSSESSATAAYCIKFSGINSLPKTTAVQCKCRAVKVISTE